MSVGGACQSQFFSFLLTGPCTLNFQLCLKAAAVVVCFTKFFLISIVSQCDWLSDLANRTARCSNSTQDERIKWLQWCDSLHNEYKCLEFFFFEITRHKVCPRAVAVSRRLWLSHSTEHLDSMETCTSPSSDRTCGEPAQIVFVWAFEHHPQTLRYFFFPFSAWTKISRQVAKWKAKETFGSAGAIFLLRGNCCWKAIWGILQGKKSASGNVKRRFNERTKTN